jgi:hypothetical protein
MANNHGYIGRSPGDAAVIIARQNYTSSGVTTDFTFTSGYTPGYLDVYLNGVRLVNATDYTAGDGSTVGLTSAAVDGDALELVAYKSFNVGNVTNATGNFDVGQKLTVSGISSLTDVVSSGIVTADSFSGVFNGTIPGISTTGFSTFKDISVQGITTISNLTASTSTTTGALIVSGGVGIAKSLFVGEGISIAGTITYADVTNVDSVGIVTAGKGFRATTGGLIVTAGVSTLSAGVDGLDVKTGNFKVTAGIASVGAGVTVSSDFIHLTDNSKIQLGIASDLTIQHNATNSVINNTTGQLRVAGDDLRLMNKDEDETYATFANDGAATLYYDNSKIIETVSAGASVYGAMKLQNGFLRENINIVANKLSAAPTLNLDNGMVHYFTTQETAVATPNVISSAGINTDMAIGDTFALTVITTAAAGGYSANWRVDGVEASAGVTSSWVGGSAPSAGGSSGLDTYALTFIKTASARYTMIGNLVNSA